MFPGLDIKAAVIYSNINIPVYSPVIYLYRPVHL